MGQREGPGVLGDTPGSSGCHYAATACPARLHPSYHICRRWASASPRAEAGLNLRARRSLCRWCPTHVPVGRGCCIGQRGGGKGREKFAAVSKPGLGRAWPGWAGTASDRTPGFQFKVCCPSWANSSPLGPRMAEGPGSPRKKAKVSSGLCSSLPQVLTTLILKEGFFPILVFGHTGNAQDFLPTLPFCIKESVMAGSGEHMECQGWSPIHFHAMEVAYLPTFLSSSKF